MVPYQDVMVVCQDRLVIPLLQICQCQSFTVARNRELPILIGCEFWKNLINKLENVPGIKNSNKVSKPDL